MGWCSLCCPEKEASLAKRKMTGLVESGLWFWKNSKITPEFALLNLLLFGRLLNPSCVLSRFRKHAGNRMNTLPRILIFEMCVHLSGIRGIRQHALYLSHDTDVVKLHANVTVLLFVEIFSLDFRIWKHRLPHRLVHGTIRNGTPWHPLDRTRAATQRISTQRIGYSSLNLVSRL